MKGKVLKKLRKIVEQHSDEYEQLLDKMYCEVGDFDRCEDSINVNNLLVSGIIRKFEELKVRSICQIINRH